MAAPTSLDSYSVLQAPASKLVRVLNELERARLQAHPIRLSAETGLPQSAEIPAATKKKRRRTEQTFIGRPIPTGRTPRPQDTRADTAPFSALRRSDPLPQQFHAIDPRAVAPDTPGAVLAQAIDTAWQHIPCRVAQVLRPGKGPHALEVFAVRGRLVRTLVRGEHREADSHRVVWDGLDHDGRGVPGGTYLFRVRAGSHEEVVKGALIR